MTEPEPQENNKTERRIFFDPSTPAVRSVSRVVVVTLVILLLVSLLGFLIYSLHNLILLVILAIFFGYLIDPLVSHHTPNHSRCHPHRRHTPAAAQEKSWLTF